jgi:hypothetical protein
LMLLNMSDPGLMLEKACGVRHSDTSSGHMASSTWRGWSRGRGG